MNNLPTVNAEISIEPIGTSDTSIGKEIAAAYNAIRNIRNLKKVTLTPMSTQIESDNLDDIFQAIRAAHNSAKSAGAKRIISTIRIDERLDKPNTLEEKVQSVNAKAIPGRSLVTQAEVEKFLGSKLNLQLATIDEQGYPNIQPVWFYYNKDSAKLYSGTQKMTKKVQNIYRNPDKIYFSIDEKNFPYRGVKGRGLASISENIDKNIAIIEKINLKYFGTLEHPLAKMLMENARNGTEIVIEITPKFFSAWDFGKT